MIALEPILVEPRREEFDCASTAMLGVAERLLEAIGELHRHEQEQPLIRALHSCLVALRMLNGWADVEVCQFIRERREAEGLPPLRVGLCDDEAE
jgi:hypothetical protein